MSSKRKKILFKTAQKNLKRGYIQTKLGQIHYAVSGKGFPLLCIHQSSSSIEEYADLSSYLGNEHQIVLFDLPGHGMSDDPEYEPGVEEFTETALSVINHLGIKKYNVLGHHGGALVAMNIGYKDSGRVNKIILSGTSGIKKQEERADFSKKLDLEKKQEIDLSGQSLMDAWQRYVKYIPKTDPNTIIRAYLNNVMTRIRSYDAHHSVLKWDRKQALENLKMPVLLMQGDEDEFVSNQENLLEILPNAKRKVISSAGAFMFFNKARECSSVIRTFLSQEM